MIALTGIPVIETERLVLRAPRAEDAEGYVRFMMSERSQYVDGMKPRPEAWRAFALEVGHWLIPRLWHVGGDREGAVTPASAMSAPGGREGWPENEIGWTLWGGSRGHELRGGSGGAGHGPTARWGGGPPSVTSTGRTAGPSRWPNGWAAPRDRGAATPEGDDCLVYRHPRPEDLA